MAMPLCESCGSQYETEQELEFETEGEFEGEFEGEGELEGEGFLGDIVGALAGEQEFEGEFEGEGEFEFEGEGEFEFEGESEFESENPIRKIYPDAMMEHLGELAAEAESEQEAAEHFLPLIGMAASKLLPVAAKALAPMAKRALPRIAKAVTRLTPQLTRGVGKIARVLHRQPAARPLLRVIPGIARRTVGSIARQAARGRVVTPRAAVRTLTRHARRVLGSPRLRTQALRRHHRMDRRLHRGVGRRMVRPHWRWRWINGRRVRVPYRGRPRYLRGAARPGAVGVAPGATIAGAPGVRYGRIVGGRCVCAACPSCGAAAPGAAPAYCRCCGQVLR
jgi:hypothetical protein